MTATATATNTPTPTATATATRTPGAACTASPSSARYNAEISVTCTGFGPRERVRLYWDSISSGSLSSFVVGRTGAGRGELDVPETPGGPHTVLARGASSSRRAATTVTVRPRASLSPSAGASGQRVKATFRSLKPGELVTIRWYVTATTTRTVARNLRASSLGTVVHTFTVPRATLGRHQVEGLGSLGSRAAATFTVNGVRPAEVEQQTLPTAVAPPTAVPTPPGAAPPTATPIPTATATAPPEPEPSATAVPAPESPPMPTPVPEPPTPVSLPTSLPTEAASASES